VDLIQEKGVPCMIYYPVPLHHQKAYRDDQHDGKLSVTEKLCTQVFSLPMHTHLDDEQLNFITNTVKSSIEELKNA
jgi:dTDP-4-amino-4,6-dideoxygalactose transaminase